MDIVIVRPNCLLKNNMLNLKKWSLTSGLIALFTLSPLHAQCDESMSLTIQALIERESEQFDIPGIEVSVICPGKDAPEDFVNGSSTLTQQIPITPAHLFQIGSETKSFIATLILLLEAEGKLSISDPLQGYLPDLPLAWQKVSIQELLNHSSGIPNYTDVLDKKGRDKGFDFDYQ